MTPAQFFDPKIGQSLLLPGQSAQFAGQCVQSVGLWVQALGLSFPAHTYAYQYYAAGIPGYTQVPKGSQVYQGDIVIFNSTLPGSGGAGHICVAKQDGSPQDFISYDSNWSVPLKLEQVEHMGGEDSYILGYLRKEQQMAYRDMTPQEVAEDYSNYTNGHVVVKAGDPATVGRKENIPASDGGEFWRGLNNQQLQIIQQLDATVADLKSQVGADYVTAPQLFIKKIT